MRAAIFERQRLVWLTRGPRAGTFEMVPGPRAEAIVQAGMGQIAEAYSSAAMEDAIVTKDEYPDEVVSKATPKPAEDKAPSPATLAKRTRRRKPSAPRKGYGRRDIQAESADDASD